VTGVLQRWWRCPAPAVDAAVADRPERRAIRIELTIVLLLTYGASAASAGLVLIDAAVSDGGIGGATVALNARRSSVEAIDFGHQLLAAVRLCAIAGLALYLLWRSGAGPRLIGLARARVRPDLTHGVALAALIGLPGLGLYLLARATGLAAEVVPAEADGHWWRLPVLALSAVANSAAEETVVVAYLLLRLRALGWSTGRALAASALLRGAYHLYQGIGAGLGNVVMGLVFGRYWQVTGRLWPLLIAHALIDLVAFVGYALLADHLPW